jgi:hypothetical protein
MINVRLYTTIGSPIVDKPAMCGPLVMYMTAPFDAIKWRSDARLKHIALERR